MTMVITPQYGYSINIEELGNKLKTTKIDAAPSCSNGSCSNTNTCSGGSCSSNSGSNILSNIFGGNSSGDGFLSKIGDFFKNLFSSIKNIFSNIFGGDGFNNGGTSQPPIDNTTTIDTSAPPVDNGGTDTNVETPTPPTDGEIPSGTSALARAIKEKFGISMLNGGGRWSEASLKAVYKTLSVLPESFRKYNKTMVREGNGGWKAGLGTVGGQGKIWLYNGAFNSKQGGTGIGTIVHEMTHNFQGNVAVTNQFDQIRRNGYDGKKATSGSVTSYGNTNNLEDMAESVKYYYLYPSQMKKSHPARYAFIKDKMMEGREFSGNEWQ